LLCLNNQLTRRWPFVTADLDAKDLEGEGDAFIHCAVRAHERQDIDDRTCWAVLALNDPYPYQSWGGAETAFQQIVAAVADALGPKARRTPKAKPVPATNPFDLTDNQQRRIAALKHRFGRSKPLFNWQTTRAVRDGHSALREADTLRFTAFLKAAWKHNWPVWEDGAAAGQRYPPGV
jgi:nucleoside-diphosphate-sugar epimerase